MAFTYSCVKTAGSYEMALNGLMIWAGMPAASSTTFERPGMRALPPPSRMYEIGAPDDEAAGCSAVITAAIAAKACQNRFSPGVFAGGRRRQFERGSGPVSAAVTRRAKNLALGIEDQPTCFGKRAVRV